MDALNELVKKWKYRQSCNNQPEQNAISKAKAHIYGICSEELATLIEPLNKVVEDGQAKCKHSGECDAKKANGKCYRGCIGFTPAT